MLIAMSRAAWSVLPVAHSRTSRALDRESRLNRDPGYTCLGHVPGVPGARVRPVSEERAHIIRNGFDQTDSRRNVDETVSNAKSDDTEEWKD